MSSIKYSKSELAQMVDRKDWKTLWLIVVPMVKHEVRCCMREGLDPFYVREDLMQEAYMAAWKALPTWNAFESSLRKWVGVKVRSAVLDANARTSSGMIGGKDASVMIVSMHGEQADDDGGDDEQGALKGPEAFMVYEEPPEGFGDPSEIGDPERLLAKVPEKDRDMVRRLCGIGVPAETQEEYAGSTGVTRRTIIRRIRRVQKNFVTFSRKLAK